MPLILNIHSKSRHETARILSNFHENPFVFEGITFSCMESFLQCLKFYDPKAQLTVAKMDAKAAKAAGRTQNWQKTGWLYWQGLPISRYGKEYQLLLDRAYDALCENSGFAQALRESRGSILIHTIGKLRKQSTVLTAFEFCGILIRKRRKLCRGESM